MMQCVCQCFVYRLINFLLFLETDFHFGRMYIDIHFLSGKLKLETDKGILMLHQKRFVGVFDGFRNQFAFDITSIDIIVFKCPVSSCNDRLSCKAIQRHAIFFPCDRKQFLCDLPSINMVDHIPETGISGTVQFGLSVYQIFKRNMVMG